jgi:hypothetical protein
MTEKDITRGNNTGAKDVTSQIREFLTRLGRGGAWQYYWDAETKQTGWFRVGDVPALPNWNSVYFNVHPQKNNLGSRERGKIDGVDVINHLYAEFDTKDGWSAEKVYALDPRPSFIIFSGGGWHCYWLLSETIEVNDKNRDDLKKLQAAWVEYTGGDGGAKDLARVLRVPYSYNNKYDEPIQVVPIEMHYDLEYTITSLYELVSPILEKREAALSVSVDVTNDPSLQIKVIEAIGKLKPERASSYEDWLNVGMALHDGFKGSQVGLALWDNWSRSNPEKYVPGLTTKKWESFDTDRKDKVTINTLFHMAEEDGEGTFIKPGKKAAKPSEYMDAVHAMGYHFTMNDMNDRIYVNGMLMTDGIEARIMTNLREHGYKDKNVFRDAFLAEAEQNRFHPIRDYLNGLEWDGVDRFHLITEYIRDEQGISGELVKRFMIGAVSRALTPSFLQGAKQQNPMLVLVGGQGLGKSVLSAWIGSVLPDLFMKGPINPDDKDDKILAVSSFIWEVEELDGTISRADRPRLKARLTRTHETFRPPYGRFEIKKPLSVSYIGTVNNDGSGFLDDPTGNRRYRILRLVEVVHHRDEDGKYHYAYEENIDINQLWAQAVALYKQGETYELNDETQAVVDENNQQYEREDALTPFVEDMVTVDKSDEGAFVSSADVMKALLAFKYIKDATDNWTTKRVAGILTKMGAEPATPRVGGKKVRGWKYLSLNFTPEEIRMREAGGDVAWSRNGHSTGL